MLVWAPGQGGTVLGSSWSPRILEAELTNLRSNASFFTDVVVNTFIHPPQRVLVESPVPITEMVTGAILVKKKTFFVYVPGAAFASNLEGRFHLHQSDGSILFFSTSLTFSKLRCPQQASPYNPFLIVFPPSLVTFSPLLILFNISYLSAKNNEK